MSETTVHIEVPLELRTGVYANVLAISMNHHEVVLDFGYRTPREEDQVVVVSRINLSTETAKQVLSTLQNSVLDMENNMRKKRGN